MKLDFRHKNLDVRSPDISNDSPAPLNLRGDVAAATGGIPPAGDLSSNICNLKSICVFVWNTFTNDARVLKECTALAEHGYDVSLICLLDRDNPDCPERETVNGFRVERVKNGLPFVSPALRMLYNLGGMFRMIIRGRKLNAAVYHANDLNTLVQAYACAGVFRWGNRRRLVYDSHEVQTSRTGYGRGAYFLERFFIRRTDANFSENLTRSAYTANLYNIDPPIPLYNYHLPYSHTRTYNEKVDLHGLLELDRDVPILLYQGGIQYGRGLDKLVEAAAFIEKGVVVMIGDGPEKAMLLERVRALGLCEKVRFLDTVPLRDLPRYTVNAYLGFQLLNNTCFNHYSASSNKLYEYIFARVPVVACDFPEISRVIREDGIGMVVDSHSPREIAGAVNALVGRKALRDQMAANCAAARSKYSWESEKHKLLDTYDRLLLRDASLQPIT